MNEQLQAAFDKKFKDTWFFEDVPLNHATPATTGRTITEADILNFAGISGEWAPIHMDIEYCKAHGHDTVLAQHMLIYTFTPSINPSDPMMAKMNNSILATKGTKNWKFLKMPAVGDTVYTTSEIVAKDDSKLKKGILARGVDELVMIADDACADLDAHATAALLARMIDELDAADLIVCGDGSADNYAQQVDVQLADALDLPVATAVCAISIEGAIATCDRMLETQMQTIQIDLPAVISVVPDAALPRIPGMKDILAAGKKPSSVNAASEAVPSVIEVASTLAPQQAERKLEMLDASVDGDIDKFAAALKAAL